MASIDNVSFSNKTKEAIVKEISQIRKNIKQKHRSMNRELLDSAENWEKQLKPIAEPLKKIVEEGEKLQQHFKNNEDKEYLYVESKSNERKINNLELHDFETPVKQYIRAPSKGLKRKINHIEEHASLEKLVPASKRYGYAMEEDINNYKDDGTMGSEAPQDELIVGETYISPAVESGKELLQTPEGKALARNYVLQEFKGRLAKEYFLKLIKGGKEIDYNYGVRVEGDQWMIGNKPLEFDVDDFLINGMRYPGTRGLYELLFMNIPSPYIYTEEDLDTYSMILRETSAHKINYSPTGKVKSNRGNKYKNIISQIVARENELTNPMTTYSDLVNDTVTGSGIILTEAKPNFIYFDDPNELVDRLRILKASQETGHTGHENEINSILEELNELDVQSMNVHGKSIVD